MRQFIKRALKKIDTLGTAQFHDLLVTSAREIDLLETVMDSLPRGILVCDTAHRLILANKAARRFLSIISYEQARETIWSLIPEEMVAEFLAQALLSTVSADEREFDIEVNGKQRLLSVSVMPVVQDRQITGSLVLVDDITERRSREARLRLMENLASLTTLAAGVAHEIKNPLGSLSIHVQLIQKTIKLLEQKVSEPDASEPDASDPGSGPSPYLQQIDKYLSVVNEEVDRLNAIVVDFLFAVRPMNAELRRGDFNAFVREVAEFVSLELKESHIALALDLADDLPSLDFDASLMKQVFLNLVKNAAAAMGEGGSISITTKNADGEALVFVADTGSGISEADISKIFEPYFTTKESGTGLGLTVVFKIINEHKGAVSVKSRKGEGTVFSFSLPVPQTERRLIAYASPPLFQAEAFPVGSKPEGAG